MSRARRFVRTTARALGVLLLLAAAGCASSRQAYRDAADGGTIVDYRRFLEQYPVAPEAPMARARIDSLRALEDWNHALTHARAVALREHLRRHPASPMRHEALRRLEAMQAGEWAAAGVSPSRLRLYLEHWPDGAHASDARRELDSLEWIGSAAAFASREPADVATYLESWPRSPLADSLRALVSTREIRDALPHLDRDMDAVARFVVARFAAARERHAAHVRSVPRLLVDPSHPLLFALVDVPVDSLRSGVATQALAGAAGVELLGARLSSWVRLDDEAVAGDSSTGALVRGLPFPGECRWTGGLIDSTGRRVVLVPTASTDDLEFGRYREVADRTAPVAVAARFTVDGLRLSFESGRLTWTGGEGAPEFSDGTVCRVGWIGRFVRRDGRWVPADVAAIRDTAAALAPAGGDAARAARWARDERWLATGAPDDPVVLGERRLAAERDTLASERAADQAWIEQLASWAGWRQRREESAMEAPAPKHRGPKRQRIGVVGSIGQLGIPNFTHGSSPDVTGPGFDIQPDAALGVFVQRRLSRHFTLRSELDWAYRWVALGAGYRYYANSLPSFLWTDPISEDGISIGSYDLRADLCVGGLVYGIAGLDYVHVNSAHLEGDGGSKDVRAALNRTQTGVHVGIGLGRGITEGGTLFFTEFEYQQLSTDTFIDWPGAIGSWRWRVGCGW